MRLIIIVNWYPPDNLVPARRWGNLVKHLVDLGVECVVVSAGDGVHKRCVGRFGETLIRLPISNQDKTASKALPAKIGYMRKILSQFKRFLIALMPGTLSQIMNSPKRWGLLSHDKELTEIASSSDYIIASYGPVGPLLLGRKLARLSRKPLVVDIRDSFESKRLHQSGIQKYFSKVIERYLLKQSAHRITIGNVLAELLSTEYQLAFSPIYNGWVDEDVMSLREVKQTDSYLYYAGSIYSHRLPALEIALLGIKSHPDVRIKIRLLKKDDLVGVREIVEKTKSAEQVEILPAASQNEVNQETAAALGVLVLEDVSDTYSINTGTVTGKLFGLLVSGTPGIALSSANGEIRQIVQEVSGWYGVDSVKDFRDALDDLLARKSSSGVSDFINGFHASEQAKKLVELLK